MKILRERVNKQGLRECVVVLNKGEHLKAFQDDAFYQLGDPMDQEILAGHILVNTGRVAWCSVTQKWVDA